MMMTKVREIDILLSICCFLAALLLACSWFEHMLTGSGVVGGGQNGGCCGNCLYLCVYWCLFFKSYEMLYLDTSRQGHQFHENCVPMVSGNDRAVSTTFHQV